MPGPYHSMPTEAQLTKTRTEGVLRQSVFLEVFRDVVREDMEGRSQPFLDLIRDPNQVMNQVIRAKRIDMGVNDFPMNVFLFREFLGLSPGGPYKPDPATKQDGYDSLDEAIALRRLQVRVGLYCTCVVDMPPGAQSCK